MKQIKEGEFVREPMSKEELEEIKQSLEEAKVKEKEILEKNRLIEQLLEQYTNVPLSRIDLKELYNAIEGIDINNKKINLMRPNLSQIKQLLSSKGYKLKEYKYICPKSNKMKIYYTIHKCRNTYRF